MPRPENESRMKAATPSELISCAQRSVAAFTPPEPCTRITAGSLSVPGFGIRNSPAITAGLPSGSPVRTCCVFKVTVSIGLTSMRKTFCAYRSPDRQTNVSGTASLNHDRIVIGRPPSLVSRRVGTIIWRGRSIPGEINPILAPFTGGQHWIACRPRFLLAVPVLSRLFRRLFLESLNAAYQAGRLQFFADQAALAQPAAFQTFLTTLRKVEWVVYAKRPFGG